jgi:hypothetical protein
MFNCHFIFIDTSMTAPTFMTTHQTIVEMNPSLPQELDAGADIVVKVNVLCPAGCDLRGIAIQVMAEDQVLGSSDETGALALKAPSQVGTHTWAILFPRQEIEGVVHEESCLVVSFTTRPHATSMAAWDVPSPVVMNNSFKVKAGVKCAAMCSLAGQLVEVRDESGARAGEGRLGEAPWPGTSALYVAEMELTAPATEGICSWSARFVPTGSELPHEEASAVFGFRTGRPPEHRVKVKVTDKETEEPLENVEVSLGVYRASTDALGLASLQLPGGFYSLNAWKAGYETLPTMVEVDKDLMIQVEALFSPRKDPDDERVWM